VPGHGEKRLYYCIPPNDPNLMIVRNQLVRRWEKFDVTCGKTVQQMRRLLKMDPAERERLWKEEFRRGR
jgi:hypothetical protein